MPVDLGHFPRMTCRRCGLVALVDPALPLDVRPSINCPVCHIPLRSPRLVAAAAVSAMARAAGRDDEVFPTPRSGRGGAATTRAAVPVPAPGRGRQAPSHLAVTIALVSILAAILIAVFVFIALMPHRPYAAY